MSLNKKNILHSKYQVIHNNTNKTLILNYKRSRYFPAFLDFLQNHTYINSSLGLFLVFFQKPKNFKKSKQLYLLLTFFFKKLLIYVGFTSLSLYIKHIPKYFIEIFKILNLTNYSSLNTEVSENPFLKSNETRLLESSSNHNTLYFRHIIFKSTKNIYSQKLPKKGIVKRKIIRKIFSNNKIID